MSKLVGAMTQIYFAGGESPDHRKKLAENGVKNVAVSWSGLRRRLPKKKAWSLADHFDDDVQLLIEAGMTGKALEVEEAQDLARAYYEFVEANRDAIHIAIAFDHPAAIEVEAPEDFYPVWNQSTFTDFDVLMKEADGRVAITAAAVMDRFVGQINSYTYKGAKIHGLGITRPSQMEAVRFSSVSSTSWVSPMRYGDRIIWDGQKLHRYPTRYKETALRDHRVLLSREGFDLDALAMEDPTEVTRLSIWSWLQYEAHLNRWRLRVVSEGSESPSVVATDDEVEEELKAWTVLPDVATHPLAARDDMRREDGRQVPLPVLGFEQIPKLDELGEVVGSELLVRNAQRSLRVCNTCRVAQSCPAFTPDSECAFGFPVEVRSREQLLSTMQALVEMQMARIGFGRFTEEMEGGTADPAVSEEIDRFFKMVKVMRELSENRESLRVQIDGRSPEVGLLSRLFGAGARQSDDSEPVDTRMVAQAFNHVMDAEVVEDQ